jgi:hypothetical protein
MRDPDLTGPATRAWRVLQNQEQEERHVREFGYGHAGVGADWIVNGPYHPFWSWWYVSVVHLRPLDGAPPPHIAFAGATHEIMCFSLNPDPKDGRPKVPDIDKLDAGDAEHGLPGFLQPPDFTTQVILLDDDQAKQLGDLVVRHIVEGNSCDSDYRGYWIRLIAKTAEHFRLGGHPE